MTMHERIPTSYATAVNNLRIILAEQSTARGSLQDIFEAIRCDPACSEQLRAYVGVRQPTDREVTLWAANVLRPFPV